MTQQCSSRIVRIINPEGLHLRPAGLFAQLANQYDAKVEIIKDGDRFDGKSALSILTLVAEQGTELCIEATGSDAQAALQALAELVEQGFPGPETAEQT